MKPCVYLTILVIGSALCASQSSAEPARPLLFIGKQGFCEEDVLATTRETLRAEFDDEMRSASDEDVRRWWAREALRTLTKKKDVRKRAELLDDLFKQRFSSMVYSALLDLVHATLFDAIVKRHDINVDRLFDMPAMRKAKARELSEAMFLYKHRELGPDRDRELYEEAKRDLGIVTEYESWRRKRARKRPNFGYWSLRRAAALQEANEWHIKAEMAHYLLSAACSRGGRFYQEAFGTFERNSCLYTELRVSQYFGKPEELNSLVLTFFNPDAAVLARGGLEEARRWFAALGPSVRIEEATAPGIQLAKAERWQTTNGDRPEWH